MNRLLDIASLLLEVEEREAVQGDLAEAGESTWRGLLDVLDLVFRRQLLLWTDWRPWLAAFGAAWPVSLTLMGLSMAVSTGLQTAVDGRPVPLIILTSQVVLLPIWAWTAGFAIATLSRRTLWIAAVCALLPCLYCLSKFHHSSLSKFCLLLFLPPAVWGVRHALRAIRIPRGSAILLALVVTGLAIYIPGVLLLNCALSWPAWYLAVTAKRSS